jgi:hypothetical protein
MTPTAPQPNQGQQGLHIPSIYSPKMESESLTPRAAGSWSHDPTHSNLGFITFSYESKDNPPIKVKRFAIELTDPRTKPGQQIAGLYPNENEALTHAIQELLNPAIAGNAQQTATNVVLVDFYTRSFPTRNSPNKYLEIQNGLPAFHTICLWKRDSGVQPNQRPFILVIDPNNQTFSKNAIDEALQYHSPLMGFDFGYFQGRLYTSSTNIGPNPGQHRDCIDIAIKIAYQLYIAEIIQNKSTIIAENSIKNLSNQINVNSFLLNTKNKDTPLRELQDSSSNEREKALQFLTDNHLYLQVERTDSLTVQSRQNIQNLTTYFKQAQTSFNTTFNGNFPQLTIGLTKP